MSETGVVKFRCEHVAADIEEFAEFAELNAGRRKLLQLRMVGIDASGIGFGNLSVRAGATNKFYITGSGTGGRPQLGLCDYARVSAYDFAKNWLRCEGRSIASSESLSHAAVYDSAPHVRAVLHCHAPTLWSHLLGSAPSTSAGVEYGTPEMALEVQRLFRDSDVEKRGLFAMGGHTDGVVAFGASVDAALGHLMRYRLGA